MITIDVDQLRQHLDEIVRMAQEEGEIFEITREGKVIARLEPVSSLPQSAKQDHATFWTSMDRLTAEISSHLPEEKVDAVEIVREGRRDLAHSTAWTNLERIATELAAYWKDDFSAVDAIRDVRREL